MCRTCRSSGSVCLRATTSLTLYVASSSAWLACSSEATDELKEKRKDVATLPVTVPPEVSNFVPLVTSSFKGPSLRCSFYTEPCQSFLEDRPF
jgi:hypothetical protein